MSVCAWQAFVLLSVGAQRLTVRYNTVMLVVSIPVHVLFISWQGPVGAALGSVLIGTVTAAWAAQLIRRVADVRPSWPRIRRVVAANAVCGGTALCGLLLGVPWWLAAVLAVAVYMPSLLLVGAVPRRMGELLAPVPDVAEGPAR
jgi:O-antigen/teichoic acid export membrane protein